MRLYHQGTIKPELSFHHENFLQSLNTTKVQLNQISPAPHRRGMLSLNTTKVQLNLLSGGHPESGESSLNTTKVQLNPLPDFTI